MPKIPFFGQAYALDSNIDAQTSICIYGEVDETQQGKSIGRMRGTPGLSIFATLPMSNILALWCGEGQMFAVAGGTAAIAGGPGTPSHLYEVFNDGTYTDYGAVGVPLLLSPYAEEFSAYANELAPAQIFPNSDGSILVINGGFAWVSFGVGIIAPQMSDASYTDLTIQTPLPDVGAPGIVSSALSPFGAADKGQTLTITGGADFTTGAYVIVNVLSNGWAVLNASPGTPGATFGQATETFEQVQASTGAYQDTYGIVAPLLSNNFYLSGIDNFNSWNSLDEGAKEGYPDHILALLADHELLWIFGDLESTEIWQDTGNANFPFQRLQAGGIIHFGLAAQYSPVRLGLNGVAWLAWSAGRGNVQAILAQGLSPVRISTHAMEEAWRGYPTVADAIAYSYIEDGHEFWVINFPSGNATWVYDFTASMQMGIPMWHQRGYWTGTVLNRQLQRCHAYGYLQKKAGQSPFIPAFSPSHFVGDHLSGNIYLQNVLTPNDNGTAILRQRAMAYVPQGNHRGFASEFQLYVDVGTVDLSITFDYSRDWGHTFINAKTLTAVAASNPDAPNVSGYNTRMRWRRLGASWSFVPRVTMISSTALCSWTDAFLDAQEGTS